MTPEKQFCPNMECSARGKVGEGNITIHSQKEARYRCTRCGKTFSATRGTALYGIKKEHSLFVTVVTLLAHGCPVQAIVAAFGLDEETVRAWLKRAGQHCQAVHEHFMEQTSLDLGQVQADEIKVKKQRGSVWMALALMVSTRLWLGGVAVDGLTAYLKAFRDAIRSPYKGEKGGRPRLYVWEDVAIVQVVKQRAKQTLTITRRIAQGTVEQVARLLTTTQNGGGINTACIERLNATFRQRLACLVRRGRALARQVETLQAGMYLVGCVYNFCTYHKSLRLDLWLSPRRRHWIQRTPAVAAGLTDHCWSVEELLFFKLPIVPFVPPKRRADLLDRLFRWCHYDHAILACYQRVIRPQI